MITALYTLLCLACLGFARSEFLRRRAPQGALLLYPLLWAALAVVLGLLALQQATGILGGITDAARTDAITEGWYGDRRPFQWLLVRTVPVIALLVGGVTVWIIRRAWPRYLLVLAAALYSVSFAVIQGISFHNIDWLLRQQSAGLQNKTWGSVAGMALTAAALLVAWRMDRRPGFAPGQSGFSTPPAPARPGHIDRIGRAAGQSLRAEGRIFTAWYTRYRAHRRRRALRPGAPGRRK